MLKVSHDVVSLSADVDDLQLRVEFMLKQMLDVLSEIVAQPVETLSRLGCACIR